MADEAETTTDTPLADAAAAAAEKAAEKAAEGPTDGPGTTDTPLADLKRLGYHEGRWHSTFTVGGELSAKQIEDCTHEALVQAQNNGYVSDGNHVDVEAHTITNEDGTPTQVVVTVAVRENRIDNGQDDPSNAPAETED